MSRVDAHPEDGPTSVSPLDRAPADRVGRLPATLKRGIERLSRLSLDDVRVTYDSPRPSQVGALAFTQGSDIHLAAGQERHLPHEAWHVVQQKQGRVRSLRLLNGEPANEDPALEQEADAIARHVGPLPEQMAPRAPVHDSAAMTRPGTAARAPSTSGRQPIQCVKWKWSTATRQWSQATPAASASAGTPPPHDGTVDDEEVEWPPLYTQAADSTVTPFLRPGETRLGERGARQQLRGTEPAAEDIRVRAVQSPGLSAGAGHHELVATNLRAEVAASGNPVAAGTQSGLRASSARVLFLQPGSTEVGAHTGFAAAASGQGSTHTRGQGPYHDAMRAVARAQLAETDPALAINAIALAHIASMPTGPQVLQSDYLTGMTPTDTSIGTLGPATAAGPPDAARLHLSQDHGRMRERFKRRVRSLERESGRGKSPSPERTPMDAMGQGGAYIAPPFSSAPLSPLPAFEGAPGSYEQSSDMSAWVTAPLRWGFAPTATSSAAAAAASAASTAAMAASSSSPSLLLPASAAGASSSLSTPLSGPIPSASLPAAKKAKKKRPSPPSSATSKAAGKKRGTKKST